jgi:hypothetical protein
LPNRRGVREPKEPGRGARGLFTFESNGSVRRTVGGGAQLALGDLGLARDLGLGSVKALGHVDRRLFITTSALFARLA